MNYAKFSQTCFDSSCSSQADILDLDQWTKIVFLGWKKFVSHKKANDAIFISILAARIGSMDIFLQHLWIDSLDSISVSTGPVTN